MTFRAVAFSMVVMLASALFCRPGYARPLLEESAASSALRHDDACHSGEAACGNVLLQTRITRHVPEGTGREPFFLADLMEDDISAAMLGSRDMDALNVSVGGAVPPWATQLYTHKCRNCPQEPSFESIQDLEMRIRSKLIRQITVMGPEIAAQKLRPHATINARSDSGYVFQHWGTSLCWWAVGVGAWDDDGKQASMLDLVFSNFSADDLLDSISTGGLPSTLGLTQVRYNIGGSPWQPIYDSRTFYRPGGAVQSYLLPNGTWNWSADVGQRRILLGALMRNVSKVMAFSNSPPWFMTISGSTTGAHGFDAGNKTTPAAPSNLADSNISRYAEYLGNVTYRFATDPTMLFGRTYAFDTLSPMNEPGNHFWYYGNDQEGCRLTYDQQAEVSRLMELLLENNQSATQVSAGEGNKPFQTSRFIHTAGQGIVDKLGLIDTHTYGVFELPAIYSIKAQYNTLAKQVSASQKPFWVTEFGTGAGPLQGGLRLAKKIVNDLINLSPLSWTLWQVGSLHQDLAPYGWAQIVATYPPDAPDFAIRKQYYAFKQFTAFIRPGSIIVGGCQFCALSRVDLVAALVPGGQTMVVVAVHLGKESEHDKQFKLDFDGASAESVLATYLTDANHNCSIVASPHVSHGALSLNLPPQSISTFIVQLSSTS